MKAHEILDQMTLDEKACFVSGYDNWHTKALDAYGIPRLLLSDGPHGLRKYDTDDYTTGAVESVPAVCYPTASALAASFDRQLLERVGAALGAECRAEDVSVLLGPGANIKRTPVCGRNFEYFSEDPVLSGELAGAFIAGVEKTGTAACVKHFAANNQESMRMTCDAVIDERAFREIYLESFERAVKTGKPRAVMCSYNRINGVFSSENRRLLTEILRDEWGFDGIVMTDWGAVKDRAKGLQAGLDLEMPGVGNVTSDRIVQAVQSGELSAADLDRSVLRLLKFIGGLCRDGTCGDYTFDRKRGHELSTDIETECAVLLKNDGLLPLKPGETVLFVGEFAKTPHYQGGGSSHINSAYVSGALESAARRCDVKFASGYVLPDGDPDGVLMHEALALAKQCDKVIVFAGLPHTHETEGIDRQNLELPEYQNSLISALAAVNDCVGVVLHNGSPVLMPWLHEVRSVLEMYLGGDGVGEAAVRLLFGECNPCGKLAETFPLKLAHNPAHLNYPGEGTRVEYREGLFVGYRYYDKKELDVLFPFGHGLSYTEFEYTSMSVSRESIAGDESVDVTVFVKNVGGVAGKETVLLFTGAQDSGVIRPVRELRDFAKVSLEPGEEKSVTFTLTARDFSYYEKKINSRYTHSGTYNIEIGKSSRDIVLTSQISAESPALPVEYTPITPVGEILKTAQGRAFLAGRMPEDDKTADLLGDGGEMMAANNREMAIVSLVTTGNIKQHELDSLLKLLNENN